MEHKTLRIEKIVFGGKGISRDLSKVTFIPFTLPGELVLANVTKHHPDFQEAEAVEIVEPSNDRVSPECPYYGSCGGCQLSHTHYRKQIEMKLEILKETLSRNHLTYPEIDVIESQPFGYRHRARLQFDSRGKRFGFFKTDSNTVVDVRDCLCLTPGLNELLKKLRSVLLPQPPSGLKYVECYENEKGETAAYFFPPLPSTHFQHLPKEIRVLNQDELNDHVIHFRGNRFPMHPSVFLQVNPGMWKAMIQEVESHHPSNQAETALELYCGTGFFTLPLSQHFQKMIACEENASSIRFVKKNHPVQNVQWVHQSAEKLKFPEDATVLIADPPRPGFTRKVMDKILAQPFDRITYISCNASSFARDVKALSGRYHLKRLTLMDLFPQTFHFETIALLTS